MPVVAHEEPRNHAAKRPFQHMLRRDDINLRVYCFYEALRMNDTIGKIVESESATFSRS
jgi:hypothetical protein